MVLTFIVTPVNTRIFLVSSVYTGKKHGSDLFTTVILKFAVRKHFSKIKLKLSNLSCLGMDIRIV